MKNWSGEQKEVYKSKLQKKLDDMGEEIGEIVKVRDQLKQDRRLNFDPESDSEIKFKYLQKFGYFIVINELKKFLEDDNQVTEDEVPKVKDVLTNYYNFPTYL